jgi:FtsZ-binding cell division protein ZapB
MTVNEIIRRNEELELQYAKAIDTIIMLKNKIKKLEEENMKLRRQNDILRRAIEIAIQIKDYNAQTIHLKSVLRELRKTKEFKG